MQNTINAPAPVSPVRHPIAQVCPNAPKKPPVYEQFQNDTARRLFYNAGAINHGENRVNNSGSNNNNHGYYLLNN